MANPRRIVLQPDPAGRLDEGTAGSALLPGTAVNFSSDGRFDPPADAAEYLKVALVVVVEYGLLGRTIDDAYAEGDTVELFYPGSGDAVQVLVKDGEVIARGDDGSVRRGRRHRGPVLGSGRRGRQPLGGQRLLLLPSRVAE